MSKTVSLIFANPIYLQTFQDESIFTLINSIALQSDSAYKIAKARYELFIESNIKIYPSVKNINYTLNYLETQYYKARQDKITITDVVQFNKSIGLS